jgi:hypothetical protein
VSVEGGDPMLSFTPRVLMGPGPSNVDARVLQAMALPTIGHLDPDFVKMFKGIYERIGPPKIVVPSGEGGGSDRKGGFQFKVDGIGRG